MRTFLTLRFSYIDNCLSLFSIFFNSTFIDYSHVYGNMQLVYVGIKSTYLLFIGQYICNLQTLKANVLKINRARNYIYDY